MCLPLRSTGIRTLDLELRVRRLYPLGHLTCLQCTYLKQTYPGAFCHRVLDKSSTLKNTKFISNISYGRCKKQTNITANTSYKYNMSFSTPNNMHNMAHACWVYIEYKYWFLLSVKHVMRNRWELKRVEKMSFLDLGCVALKSVCQHVWV